jgi:hypothetical protein
MPSVAQIRANRANSARSTGPRTAKGIAASSSNALRHGLTAQQHLIGDEDEGQFEALLAGLNDSHQPANAAESILVTQIAEHYWRLMRARRIETGFWEKKITSNNDIVAIPGNERFRHESQEQQFAHIFKMNEDGMFDRMMRYEASIERSYYRAIKQLEHLQLTRKKAEKPIGFVSQKPVASVISIVKPSQPLPPSEPETAHEPVNPSEPRQNGAVAPNGAVAQPEVAAA